MKDDLETIAQFADSLAETARSIAIQHFRHTTSFERKLDESPVTIADRAIEAAMREAIERAYPDHGILGEESGASGANDRMWVLDPIDGTKSFITGMPLFGTLIAFVEQGAPAVGVIEMPALHERWVAKKGGTSFAGRPVRVSGCERIGESRVYTSSPDFFSVDDWERYDRLSRQAAIRRFGGDCYQYGLLSSGYCDLVIETSLMPYDFMPLVPVVEGAGGIITDWEGQVLDLRSGGRIVASSTRALHEQAMELLNQRPASAANNVQESDR